MPPLVRFLLVHAAIGFSISFVFVAMLMVFNVNGLWTLVSTSELGLLALVMLTVANGLTFGGVQVAIAVMMMGEEAEPKDPNDGLMRRVWCAVRAWLAVPSSRRQRVAAPVPVRVDDTKRKPRGY